MFTLGYEGLAIETFIARLKQAGVRTVVDVRELPLSRKKGFSKTKFAEALSRAGVAYTHMPKLGCPKPIRERYKRDGDWSTYSEAFDKYLAKQSLSVAELGELALGTTVCLVCFEADFRLCHRSMVGRAAAKVSRQRLVHLTATGETADAQTRFAA